VTKLLYQTGRKKFNPGNSSTITLWVSAYFYGLRAEFATFLIPLGLFERFNNVYDPVK